MADRQKTYDFPQDLREAQMELHQVQSALADLYKRLPWSSAPLPGWTHTKENGRFYETERPESPGWTDEEATQVGELRSRQLDLAARVVTHPFWSACDDAPAARSALKHLHEQEERDEQAEEQKQALGE